MGLSPFEILNRPMREVFNLYADCIIHDRKANGNQQQDVWVTSKTANWH